MSSDAADCARGVHQRAASRARGLPCPRLHGENLHLVLREAQEREDAGPAAGCPGHSVWLLPTFGQHGLRGAEARPEAFAMR